MYRNKTINAFIQVSLTSKRLPGKALLDINGKKAIEWLIINLNKSKYIDNIVLTITNKEVDDPLEKWALENKISYYRGNYLNVLQRFAGALEKFPCDCIIRATGDCPVVCYELADQLIEKHLESDADYSKYIYNKLPVGTSSEIFNRNTLLKLLSYKLDFNYSEYMSYYFINNPDVFSINDFDPPANFCYPDLRLTLDYEEDLVMFRNLFEKLDESSQIYSLKNILKILTQYPEISKINSQMTLKYLTDSNLIEQIKKATRIDL